LFIWEKLSGKLVHKLKADENVVNGVAPHPFLPILATCGIDSDGKIFDIGSEKTYLQEEQDPVKETNESDSEPDDSINILQLWEIINALKRRSNTREEPESENESENEDIEVFNSMIKEADSIRIRANEFFNNSHYVESIENYNEALKILDFQTSSEEIKEKQQKSKLLCMLNRAAANLKLGNNDEVIDDCSFVLSVQPENKKALTRRGTAYMNKKEYEKANQDLTAALKLSPEDPTIINLIQQLKLKWDEEKTQ